MNFSFGARAAPTSNSCLVDIYHGWHEVSDQVHAEGYRKVQSGEHQDPGALCRPPGQGEGVGPVTKIFHICYKNISRYDLEANLALLKLYQFNPTYNNLTVVVQILLKSLTNLPHTDFVLCKCLLSQEVLEEPQVTSLSSN